jgi:hypothetical protein
MSHARAMLVVVAVGKAIVTSSVISKSIDSHLNPIEELPVSNSRFIRVLSP